MSEFHPVGYTLSETTALTVADDYFRTDPWVDEFEGSYADLGAATQHNVSVAWNHPISSVISSVIGAGFELRFFHEFDYTLFRLNEWMVEGADTRWHWPSSSPRLPLMYSLKAYKPE